MPEWSSAQKGGCKLFCFFLHVCEPRAYSNAGGCGRSSLPVAVAGCTALAAVGAALLATLGAVLVAGVLGDADGLAEALAGDEGVVGLGHEDVCGGQHAGLAALDGAADDDLVLVVAAGAGAAGGGGLVVAVGLEHKASVVALLAAGAVRAVRAAGAAGGGGLVVVLLLRGSGSRCRLLLCNGPGEHLDEVGRVDGGEGDALDQHAGLAEGGEDGGQLDDEVTVGAERLEVGLGHLVVVHSQLHAVVVGDTVCALDEDVDLVDRDGLLAGLVDEGALADGARELLGEEGTDVLGKGAVHEGAEDCRQGGVIRLGHLEVVGVVCALHAAGALEGRVLGDALLAEELVHRVDLVLDRHHALELAEAVAGHRGEQDLLAVRRAVLVHVHRGTADGSRARPVSAGGAAGGRHLVGELLCEGEQRGRLHVQRSPDAGCGSRDLAAHGVDVARLDLLELGVQGTDHGVLGGAHGLEVAGLGGVGGSQLVLDGGDLSGVLAAQEVHGVVAGLSDRRVICRELAEEHADDFRVGLGVGHCLEELEEDAVEDGGHHRVRLVLVLEGELGAEGHGAVEVDLLDHAVKGRQLLHGRGDAGSGLDDGLDHGCRRPGEVGEGSQLQLAATTDSAPASLEVGDVLVEGLVGVGAAAVELQVTVHVLAEGLEGHAAVLDADVLGRGGVDVGEHGLLVGGEVGEADTGHVGADRGDEAEGRVPGRTLVVGVDSVGSRAARALQDPAGEGGLAGAVGGAVAADDLHLAVV